MWNDGNAMTTLAIFLIVILLCSLPCWLAWRQTVANRDVLTKVLWTVEDFKSLLIKSEHEAGYVSGTADERKLGADRAADLAALAVTVSADRESDVFDPEHTLMAHIKPTERGKGERPRVA